MYICSSSNSVSKDACSLYDCLYDMAEEESQKESPEPTPFECNLAKLIKEQDIISNEKHALQTADIDRLVNFITQLITLIKQGKAPKNVHRYKSSENKLARTVTYSNHTKKVYLDLKTVLGRGRYKKARLGIKVDTKTLELSFFCPLKVSKFSKFDPLTDAIKECLREDLIAKQMNHPNLLAPYEEQLFYTSTKGEDKLWMATDAALYSGVQYQNLEPKPLLQNFLKIFIQVAKGLKHLHDQDMIYRDVKPANILIYQDLSAKLIDFGLVCHKDATIQGFNPGTLSFQPAQIRNLESTQSKEDDIYGFGMTMLVMYYGTLKEYKGLINNKYFDQLPPNHPEKVFSTLLNQTLSENREERGNLTQIIRDLESILSLIDKPRKAIVLGA